MSRRARRNVKRSRLGSKHVSRSKGTGDGSWRERKGSKKLVAAASSKAVLYGVKIQTDMHFTGFRGSSVAGPSDTLIFPGAILINMWKAQGVE